MSVVTWLAKGLEQFALPITQPLPVQRRLVYRVGGNHVVTDAVASNFNPHFWLFELATAVWKVGYDVVQRPVYETSLVQFEVFHVLLVDYWKPPVEDWRRNQPILYGQLVVDRTYTSAPAITGAADSGSGAVTGADDGIVPYVQVGVAG